ncbi:MAG: squalene/phytoene synthase family protein [Phycisphaerales bacterium]|nr:MAG: squalene/phytoene synthase family protein [Phycisphaerales bacterium]
MTRAAIVPVMKRRVDAGANRDMLAAAMTDCRTDVPLDELLQGVSRTFALSIPELPSPLGIWVGSAYLVCRIVDTVEDHPADSEADRQRMFDDLLATLGPPLQIDRCQRVAERFTGRRRDEPCCRLMNRCGQVFAQLAAFPPGVIDAVRACAVEMIGGLRKTPLTDAGDDPRWLCATLDDLERYCHYAAGVVGMMLTRLFDLHLGRDPGAISEERMSRARRFGQGLQLTNIVKDHPSDLSDGRVFIPPEVAHRCDLDPNTLLQPALPLPVRAVIVARAADHLDQALAYTLGYPAVPSGIRLFCLQPLMMALMTLDRALTHVDVTPDDRPKITREQVDDVMTTSRRLVGDDAALHEWYTRHRRVLAQRLADSPAG